MERVRGVILRGDGPSFCAGADVEWMRASADLDVDVIWVDGLNPRPKVWEAVQALLAREWPDLVERYRRILFSPPVRTAYIKGIRDRVARAAKKIHISERVDGCV